MININKLLNKNKKKLCISGEKSISKRNEKPCDHIAFIE